MKVTVDIDPGICNFVTTVYATTNDSMHVDIQIVSECQSILELAKSLKDKMPIDAYQELSPKESAILETGRKILVSKGCCEACVVPAGICKAVQVAANLALPKDVAIKIQKEG